MVNEMELSQINGFESLESEFEHTCAITNGIAELAQGMTKEDEIVGDALYADTVLKLHDIDLVEVDGQENFLDSIKRGSAKAYEWIKNLIKTIREWIIGKTSRDYSEAKKSLETPDIIDTQVKKLAAKGIDAYVEHDVDNGVVRIVKRLSAADKSVVNQKIKLVALSDEAEARHEEIQSETMDRITTAVRRQLVGIGKHIDEIKRIDPNGETLATLFTTIDSVEKAASLDKLDKMFTGTQVSELSTASRALIKSAGDIQAILSSATVSLDKLNEANKDVVEEGSRRTLSRAVSVVKELSAIAARYRDAVITLDSQLQMGEKKTSKAIVREAIIRAKDEVSEDARVYLRQLADDFMN